MPKIVILGSLSYGDYEVTAPKKVREDYHNEDGYQLACQRIYPMIDEVDIILVYGKAGEHTQRDIDYALEQGKQVISLEVFTVFCQVPFGFLRDDSDYKQWLHFNEKEFNAWYEDVRKALRYGETKWASNRSSSSDLSNKVEVKSIDAVEEIRKARDNDCLKGTCFDPEGGEEEDKT